MKDRTFYDKSKRLGRLILEIMGNILMIIGNLDMTCFGRESGGGQFSK